MHLLIRIQQPVFGQEFQFAFPEIFSCDDFSACNQTKAVNNQKDNHWKTEQVGREVPQIMPVVLPCDSIFLIRSLDTAYRGHGDSTSESL